MVWRTAPSHDCRVTWRIPGCAPASSGATNDVPRPRWSRGVALAEILERLHARGVPTAVLGGLRSVESIYGDAGSRPVDEHDLLVRSADRTIAEGALASAGFEATASGRFDRGGMVVRLRTDPLQPPAGRGAGAAVFHLSTDRLLRRANPGRVAGAPALIPEPEDEMLILAADAVRHAFERLIRTADLAHMIAAHGTALRWDRLRERAAASRSLRVLGLALRSAEALGVAADRDAPRGSATGRLERFLLGRSQEIRPVPYGGAILMALSAPRLRDGLRYLFQNMLTAGEQGEGSRRSTTSAPSPVTSQVSVSERLAWVGSSDVSISSARMRLTKIDRAPK